MWGFEEQLVTTKHTKYIAQTNFNVKVRKNSMEHEYGIYLISANFDSYKNNEQRTTKRNVNQ